MTHTLLTTHEAAEYLSVSPAFLERDRCATGKVRYVRLGTRSIRYRLSDLNEFIESNIQASTSSYNDE